jgi:5-methylcytosine-specific restriction endonuclease McrA
MLTDPEGERAKARVSREVNREARNERERLRLATDPEYAERVRNRQRKYRAAHREAIIARERARLNQVLETNPEHYRAQKRRWAHRRRAFQLANGTYSVTNRDLHRLKVRQGGRCAMSGCEGPAEHLDHRQPVSRKGRYAIGNLDYLCQYHNQSKGPRLLVEFRFGRPARTA